MDDLFPPDDLRSGLYTQFIIICVEGYDSIILSYLVSNVYFNCIVQDYLYHNMDIGTIVYWYCVLCILTYGSDIWGFSKMAGSTLDKVFLNYNRCALHVKATTCNAIVNGECGKFPPSVHCHINVLTYYHRLLTMSKGKMVKSVFKALHKLNDQGFQTWITRVSELAHRYGIDINETASIGSVQFKSICSNTI